MPDYDKAASQGALSNAERQARYRARGLAAEGVPVIRVRRAADRRSRPQRWRDAVSELLAPQSEYSPGWMGSPTACTAARRPMLYKRWPISIRKLLPPSNRLVGKAVIET